jgi:hypothetical protein
MVAPTDGQPVASWIKVGARAAGNQLQIADEARKHLIEGRLLFTRSAAGK